MGKEFLSERAQALRQGGIRAFFDKAAGVPGAINLGIGEPDLPTPGPVTEAGFRAARAGSTHYTANAGLPSLRQAIAGYLERFHIQADPAKEIIVTSGGMAAVSMALQCAVNPGEEVLIQDPQWLNYVAQVQLAGGVPVRVPVDGADGFALRPGRVEAAITPATKALLINSPNNPTGAVMTREEQQAVAEAAIRHDLLVISDEVYCELVYDGSRHQSIATLPGMAERTVVVGSLSKSFAMTGWRIGFAAGPARIIEKMVYLQENLVACASVIGQHAAIHALESMCGVEEMRAGYQRRRDFFVGGLDSLPGISCPLPSGAFYAFPDITGTGLSSQALAELLLEQAGVVAVPGSAFGGGGEGYLRMSYAASEEDLAEAVRRMRPVLERISKERGAIT